MPSSDVPPAFGLYRRLRDVEPPESPVAGTLAEGPGGQGVLLVDRPLVADWPGWGVSGEDHVLAPLDVVRRADGHDVVLPALLEGVDRFLQRRADADAPLSSGEAVTLAVSVVRGLAASLARAEEDAPSTPGAWWLADGGRPVLVEGPGEAAVRDASAEVLSTLASGGVSGRLALLLGDVAEAAAERGFVRDAPEWEDRLFEVAAAEPLVTEVLGPLRARAVSAVTEAPVAGGDDGQNGRSSWWQGLARHVDADLAAAASDAVDRMLHRLRSRKAGGGRGRAVLLAGGMGAVIVVGGLMWPTGSADTAVPTSEVSTGMGDSTVAPPADGPAPTSPPNGEALDEPPASLDPGAIATDLLDRRRECADAACLASVQEDPAAALPSGVIDAEPAARTATMLDDLGGLVVIRVDAAGGGGAPQLLTLVETTEGWRIRDVHDVVDAPS